MIHLYVFNIINYHQRFIDFNVNSSSSSYAILSYAYLLINLFTSMCKFVDFMFAPVYIWLILNIYSAPTTSLKPLGIYNLIRFVIS